MTTQTAEKALIPVSDQKEIEKIYLGDGLSEKINAIKADAKNFVADVSTAAGRKVCKSKAYEIAKHKGVIDRAGKDLGEQYRKDLKKIQNVRNAAVEELNQVQFDVRKPLTDWEMEEDRKERLKKEAVELELMMEEAIAENELFDRQKKIERKEAELREQEEARLAKERAEHAEKEQKEREVRIAQEARERAEREAQEAIEFEKRAKIEAELKAKQDAERAEREKREAAETAEREKLEAIEQAKREEIERQERERLAKEEEDRKQREAEEKKAANVAHKRKINKAALDCFVKNGISEKQGKELITMIAKREIKHITINY